MADLPDYCLRGLRTKDHVVRDDALTILGISGMAFEPDINTEKSRSDGGIETSINWEDDTNAIEFTRNQPNSSFGVARLKQQKIAEANSAPNPPSIPVGSRIFCERDPKDDNSYHGNIVFFAKVHKTFRKMIAGELATYSEFIPPLAKYNTTNK